MRILVVGGLDRNESQLTALAAQNGHDLELHTGDVGGRGADILTRKVERSDLVVIATEVNSHGGVLLAKKIVRKFHKPSLILRKVGASKLQGLFDAIEARTFQPHAIAS
ncbi:MAG TPA: DUF2325 domain-containing protein [Polyangiaceae bacterium]